MTRFKKIQKAILGDGIEKNELPFPNTPLLAKMIRINNCLLNTYFVPGTGRSPLCAFPPWAVIALEVARTLLFPDEVQKRLLKAKTYSYERDIES